jgi:hypothetical protein
MYTIPFFFFTTLSSPIAPFWNRISLKCVCVCARLPACLTVYVRVDQKNEWWVLVWNINCNDYCYSVFYYLFVLTITIRQHTSLYIESSKTKGKTRKKKCSKMKMLTDTLRWLFSGFLSLSLFSSSMLFFFYIKYAKDIYSKSTRRVVALLFRFSSLHSPPLLLLSLSVFLIRFFFSFFHTALLKGHYLLSNNIIIIIIV